MHGSSTVQVGGGAAGVLIVNDAAGEVPPEIANMQEVIMILQHLNLGPIIDIQKKFNYYTNGLLVVSDGSIPSATMLVNGQSQPKLTMNPGKWYRWRLVFVATDAWATLKFTATTSTASCQMQL